MVKKIAEEAAGVHAKYGEAPGWKSRVNWSFNHCQKQPPSTHEEGMSAKIRMLQRVKLLEHRKK